MGILEEELKKRFSDSSEKGFVDAEDLWSSVSETLDSSEGIRPAGYWKWGRIAGLVLLFGTIGTYFFQDQNENTFTEEASTSVELLQAEAAEEKKEEMQSVPTEVGNENVEPVAFQGGQVVQEDALLVNNSEPVSRTVENKEITTAVNGQDESKDHQILVESLDIPAMTNAEEINSEGQHMAEQSTRSAENLLINKRVISKMIQADPNEPLGQDEIRMSNALDNRSVSTVGDEMIPAEKYGPKYNWETEIRQLRPLSIEAIDCGPYRERETNVNPIERASESNYPHDYARKYTGPTEVTIGLGADALLPKYEDAGSGLNLNDLMTAIPGYSASFMSSWISDKGIRLSIGLEYSMLRTRFDYETERETAYLDEDRLILFELDEMGDTINAVYEDTWMTAIETRTILHHNEAEMLTVPIAVGYERDFGRIGIGLDLGLSYGIILSQRGRSIDGEGAVADFDTKKGTDAPFNSSVLAYSVSPMIDYKLSDALSIRLSPQVRILPDSDSEFHGLKQRATIYRIMGGLTYRLK